jgi:Tfp pilus assembly major pilin PilA
LRDAPDKVISAAGRLARPVGIYSLEQGSRFARRRRNMKSRQSGITLIGFVIMLAIVGFFAFMAMKLVPSYIEYMGVVKALNQMSTEGGNEDIEQARRQLAFKMSFQYVDDSTIKPKDVTIQRTGNASVLRVSYDKVIPFIYNIAFLLHFEKSVPLKSAVGQ